jgi:two-component system sensor histidine kinase RegB
MQQQVDLCASRLKALTQSIANNEDTPQPITQFMNELLSTWQLQRPHAAFDFSPPDKDPIPWVNSNVSLRQALLNLLNNAADASAAPIHLGLDWDTRSIWLKIQDQGPGLTPEQMQTLGKPFVTTKGGLGIGLFLTTSTLASQKGDVRLYNHPQGGTLTEVRLAIHSIQKA